jgi:hypothetical protein
VALETLRDFLDGFGVIVRPTRGFSLFATKLVVTVASYLAAVLVNKCREFLPLVPKPAEEPKLDFSWLEGQAIPLRIEIDPEVDIRPHRLSRFVGGPYDNKEYVVDQTKTSLLLEGGHKYVWEGKSFVYVPAA